MILNSQNIVQITFKYILTYFFKVSSYSMNDIKAIIDIWNWYIKWLLLWEEGWEMTVLAKDIIKTRWMRKWKVLDNEEFAHCINELLESFARKIWNDFVEEVIVWVSHPETVVKRISESKRILSWQVAHEDIQHLSDVVSDSWIKANYEVVKIIPVQWVIDDKTRVKDPLWMEARRIDLIADVFMLPKTFSSNIYEAFDRLDVHVIDIIPNILWAVEVCLDFDVKDLGVLLIDLWANQTSYVVYEEGYPILHGVLPIWWEDVTKDISIWLQVDIKDAERIKREKGAIMMEKVSNENETIDMGFLSDIMLARYEEIFELIQEHLQIANKDGRLPWWVILTWWASKVKNIESLAKDVFKLAVFRWNDKVMQLGELSHNQQFINVIWNYVRSNKYQNSKKKKFNLRLDFWFIRGLWAFFKKMF